ncbi:MAG: hypothetical protein JWP25_4646 [Bradyrhizobium sp.]|nr:hypothetical protein [Bradyrhizobium sp.]
MTNQSEQAMTDSAQRLELCPFCGKEPGIKVGPPPMVRCITDGCEGKKHAARTVIAWNDYAALRSSALPETGKRVDLERMAVAHAAKWGDGPRGSAAMLVAFGKAVLALRPSPDGAVRIHRTTEVSDAPIGQASAEDDAP